MSSTVLTNVRLFAVGADLSGQSNKVEISAEVEAKDKTNYRSDGWKEIIGGVASTEITGEGQWQAGDPGLVDDASWSQLGGQGPWTLGVHHASIGDLSYFTYALRANYKLGASIGDVAPWSGTAKGVWPLVRGQFAHATGVSRTTSGTGTGLQLGAVATGKRLYAALHVLSVAGTTPSITVAVESDVDNTFTTPTTQLTFAPATAAGGQILRTDGTAITDSWFRVKWTITGTTPSFMFVAALGVM